VIVDRPAYWVTKLQIVRQAHFVRHCEWTLFDVSDTGNLLQSEGPPPKQARSAGEGI